MFLRFWTMCTVISPRSILPLTDRTFRRLCRSLALAGISRSRLSAIRAGPDLHPQLVVLVYEHILSLVFEIQYIWPTRRSFSSAWFLCIRYFSFGANIIVAVDNFATFDVQACYQLLNRRSWAK